jgi:hypothetical protein
MDWQQPVRIFEVDLEELSSSAKASNDSCCLIQGRVLNCSQLWSNAIVDAVPLRAQQVHD